MNKQAKIALAAVGTAVVAGGVYYFFVAKPKQTLAPYNPGASTTPATNPNQVQNVVNTAQNAANQVQNAVQTAQQVIQPYLPAPAISPSPAPAGASAGLKSGNGLRVTDGTYSGYVYLYTVNNGVASKQWITSSSLLQKYFGNANLGQLIAQGIVVNVSSSVANQIPEAAKLLSGFKGFGNPYPSANLRGLFS